MTLYYQERNLKNINQLADHTKVAARKWHDYLVKNNINILIYETIRTEAQQRENVRKGASQTMKSYHLVGQALDFVPVDSNGQVNWNDYSQPKIQQAITEAKRLGFEWGGDWKSFVDKPHLQYNYKGYGTDTFGKYSESTNVATQSNPNESIVDYLSRKGIDSSFANRSKLAVQYGVVDYKGTASQNVELLNKLKQSEVNVATVKEETKVDVSSLPVSDWASEDWEEVQENGYFDGSRPQANITRQETAIVVNRIRHNFLPLIKELQEQVEQLQKEVNELKK